MATRFDIRSSQLFREAATLLSGNVLAQGVGLLAYLVLTRIFSPEDFALYNILLSYIEVMVIASTCKYEMAVVAADDEAESTAVARFTLRLNALVSFLLLTVVLVLYLTHSLPGNYAQLGWMVLLIPPMVFLTGSSRVYTALFNRARSYRTIAANTTFNSMATAVLKALLGLLGMHRSGMPLGTVIGQSASNLLFRWRLRSLHLPPTTRQQRLAAAAKHKRMPLFVATKDFINAFSYNLPFIWLALHFEKPEVGLFALALTFTSRPASMLNGAIEKVLYARTAEAVRAQRSIWAPIGRYLLLVNVIAIPICLVLGLWAEPLFAFFFSGRWVGCGVFVQLLLPWTLISLSAAPLNFLSIVFSAQRQEFGFYVALCVLRVVAIAVGIASGRFLLAIALYAAAGALVSVSLLVWYLWLVRRYERQIRIQV